MEWFTRSKNVLSKVLWSILLPISINDFTAICLTTVSSLWASYSKMGSNSYILFATNGLLILGIVNNKSYTSFPISWAMANSTSSSSISTKAIKH